MADEPDTEERQDLREVAKCLPPLVYVRAVAHAQDPLGDMVPLRVDGDARVYAFDPVAREALAVLLRFLFTGDAPLSDAAVRALLRRLEGTATEENG